MLVELRIRDFAIIDSLTLPLAPGFNVLSGETGAGKSIIVGALALLLGDPLRLILIGANVGAVGMVILSVHTLVANRALLPRALRPALWRESGVVACALFFAWLVARALARPLDVLALFR